MKQFSRYSIEFIDGNDSGPQTVEVVAANPGHAFAKCLQRFPQARVLRGCRWGYLIGDQACIWYDAPSTAKVESLPASDAEEQTFAFFDGCIGKKPR